MRENHDFVIPVNILTPFACTLFSWTTWHTTVRLYKLYMFVFIDADIGAIVGAAVGGIFVGIIVEAIFVVVVFCCFYKSKKKES